MSLSLIYKHRKFTALFWTQFLGALNDNFLKNAMVVMITFKGIKLWGLEAQSLIALAAGIFILPFFLFSSTAGQIADRYERARLTRYIKLWELGLMALATYGFYAEDFQILMITLFLMGLQSTFFGPIKYSILPDLLEEEELVSGNAYVEMGTFLAILLGTIAGGLAAAAEESTIIINGGLLVIAGVGVVLSWLVPAVPIGDPSLKVSFNPIPKTVETIGYTRESTAVFNSILGISWFWFLGAAILTLLPTYCKQNLMGSEEVVTALLASFTIGIGIGSIICEKLSFQRVELGLVPIGSFGVTIFLLDLCYQNPPWIGTLTPGALLTFNDFLAFPTGKRILIDLLGLATFGGFFIVPLYTLIQQRSRPEVRSRIIAGNNIINALFMVVSSIMIMVFNGFGISIETMFFILAVQNLVVTGYIYSVVPEFTLRFLSWALVNVMYRLRVNGLENIPKEGPVVLACNHVSYVDWLVIAGACKRPPRFVMFYKFLDIKIARPIFKGAKVIPISGKNEDPKYHESAFEKISEELKNNQVICIFPEGNLTKDGETQPFRPGIERIIKNDPVPVIPMALNNLWGSMFSWSGGKVFKKMPRRFWHKVSLDIGKPLDPQTVTAEKLEGIVKSLIK